MITRLRRYEFSERLADILGQSRRDLRVRVTLLVTGGLIPPGPRGPGAPPATPEYAADLLIGVMAAPQQTDTVEAVQTYRALVPAAAAAEAPGVMLKPAAPPSAAGAAPATELVPSDARFGEALASLLERASDPDNRSALAQSLFGVWVARGFPAAALQLAAWGQGRRTIVTRRYSLAEGARPPAWLDPDRGGAADPGLLMSVFLPASKLIQIGLLTTPERERKPAVLDLGHAIGRLADLAQLARRRRDRRPWEKFLETAAAAERLAEDAEGRTGRYREVAAFGSNPGNLRMLTYVPEELAPGAPLVVVLHGCTQTAESYDRGSGWSTLADRHGFALLLPEQRRRNNPLRCFNWFRAEDMTRESGEALSIRQMVAHIVAEHGLDPARVYVTGLSAGGAMTSVMLATYPEVFAGGAILSATPYGAASGLQDAFDCIFQGRSQAPRAWGDRVRAASPHSGPWPKISVWHGDADATVQPMLALEIVKQWTDVHGLKDSPSVEVLAGGHTRSVWHGPDGEERIESYTVAGMAHGAAVSTDGEDGCGAAAPFFHDVGLSSTTQIARFWGLTATRREVRPSTSRTAPPPASEPMAAPPPPPAATGDAVGRDVIRLSPFDPTSRDRAAEPAADPASDRSKHTPPPRPDRPEPPEAAGAAGIDLQRILAGAFEAAGLMKAGGATKPGDGAGPLAGIDIPGILATSFEAAGLLQGGGERRRRSSGGGPGGIDIPGILAKSFEAAGLLKTTATTPPPATSAADGGLAAAGWQGDGWRLLASATSDGEPTLHGVASSGLECDVGTKIHVISRPFSLGPRPTLSYRRRLDLNAAVNMFTTASFRVLIDGDPVDEVSVVGMDYAEAEWTERSGIDLSAYAGRTVTLSLEVTANSNVCIEVFAKAWVSAITVQDHPQAKPGCPE